ncbi:LCP family protein [Romboutsia lituseburensis]|uniref:Cell envelope-related function transcriptional attenuator common domain-containing protein n=1 Tax=Romboutsia lituseburensis DSM 797 TaxID=1121325 RepID=A0A1G9PNU1_9FIRM|nr:LCP family protein [Romboutsia lituseburensis]CEH33461.1 LytR transcriptional regulator [Romboutsia lituseburensis]SDM00359.1 cell envelope-related function transcriptional attenuator common domain-containing protein [Romboutsia lituseburensis DSM 797]
MSYFKKIVIGLVITLSLIILAGFGFVYSKLNSIYVRDEAVKSEQDSNEKMVEGITNILLVGIDGRYIDKGNRSDSVMLVTIDSKNKDIKITSIARDTYVDIPGYSTEKLTHAYAYEGIDLLKEVFKVNFDIKIDKYIAVNFVSFMDIMDELGGVEVNIDKKDIDEVNKYIDDCYEYYYNKKDEVKKEYITKSGTQRLNGYQALAFSRIRYTDSAFARDNRHREVAQSVYKEFLKKGPEEYKKCADILLENTKTNISPIQMLNLGYTVFNINDKDIEQLQFPLEEHRNGHIINDKKGWVLEWDKEPNIKAWHEFIYGNENK